MNENRDNSSLTVKIIAIILVVAAVIGLICFLVFNKPQPHKDLDLSYAGKYVLSTISGLTDKDGNPVTKDSYEYNYIELGDDGRYEIANKYNGKSTSQKGVWYIKEDTVFFESSRMFGFVKTTDTGKIDHNTITLTIISKDKEVTLVMTKE